MIYSIDVKKLYEALFQKNAIERDVYIVNALIALSSNPESARLFDWVVKAPEVKKRKTKERKVYNSGYSPAFLHFWEHYPSDKRVAKGIAYQVWQDITGPWATGNHIPEDELSILCQNALDWQRKLDDWTKNDGQFIPKPENYLKGRRWEDTKPKNLKTSEEFYYDMDGVRRKR